MNRLANTRCYLAGAIEKVMDSDGGVTWRNKVKVDLVGFKIHFLDPTDKPIECGKETPDTWKALNEFRLSGEYGKVRNLMLPICRIDLRMVDISDFLIVNIDPDVPTFGTHEEVGRASSQNKPVLVRVEGGKDCAPLWWYERLDPKLFFSTWEELYDYLWDVSNVDWGNCDIGTWSDYKWLFFDWMGEK